jgi:hypothetical protein
MNAEGRHAAELLGEAGSGSAGHGLLADAVECGEDESNDVGLVVLDAVQRRCAKSSGS